MKRSMTAGAALLLAISALAVSCDRKPPQAPDRAAPMSVADAVANPARPAEDRADDPLRKPANVLTFIGVGAGMKVFEIEAGAGYYTELFSAIVGPGGEVIMHNPPAFDGFLGDAVAARVDGRLSNVRVTKSNFDALDAPDNSVDMATWMLGPHDLFYEPNGAFLGDAATAFAEAFRILKPGGTFVIVDHAAPDGAPRATGGTIHRIDKAIVLQLAADAGFTLTGESDVLRNPEDDHTLTVFDPSVRRKTDRFILKYAKLE